MLLQQSYDREITEVAPFILFHDTFFNHYQLFESNKKMKKVLSVS